MDEAVVADLKQFITGIISQQTADIRQDVRDLKEGLQQLDTKVDDGFAAIASILEDMHTRDDTHEACITQLEHKAA